MGLNPKKCVFGIDSGKLLGFIISKQGIEVDTENIDAIINIPPPKNISHLHSLQGKIQVIHCFLSKLADRTIPFTSFLRKDTTFSWNDKCKQNFEQFKEYLENPPIL